MSDQIPTSAAIRDGSIVILSALGLQLEPPVFIACILLAAAGAVVGRGFSPVMARRRAFGLNLAGGILAMILALLLNQWLVSIFDWWPNFPAPLLAILSGLLGPLAIPLLMKRFPDLAERFVGKWLPANPNDPTNKG